MIIAEFTFSAAELSRVYDTVTGADLEMSTDLRAKAYAVRYGEVRTISKTHVSVTVGYEIKELT